MNEQKNNGRGIFYGVIGVATLVVAIIGATFAYFTATNSAGNNVITGNMATIKFGLSVSKVTTVDETKGGMIPMSNTMVEAAVSNTDGACLDDNGNAVCQIYQINVDNTGTATLYLDGYVTLTGGSGLATDAGKNATNKTSMRWAQVFQNGEVYTTAGTTTTTATTEVEGGTAGIDNAWASLDNQSDQTGLSDSKILTSGVTATGQIKGNDYDIINTNYIRISDHTASTAYDRTTDVTSALVFNQYLDASDTGITTDSITYYIVVWLTETGTDQTLGSGLDSVPAEETNGLQFFNGSVTFNSAQGSEVTATFTGYTAVPSQTTDEEEGS